MESTSFCCGKFIKPIIEMKVQRKVFEYIENFEIYVISSLLKTEKCV